MAFFADLDRQLAEPSQEPPHVRARRTDQGSGGAPSSGSNDQLLRDLVRFTLYRSQDVKDLMNANALAFLISSEELKRTLKESQDAYKNKQLQQHGGDVEAARAKAREERRQLEAHPWGSKKYFNYHLLCKYYQKMGQDWSDDQKAAMDHVLSLTPEQVDSEVAACYSKFQTPMEGRTWKYSLLFTTVCRPETRAAFATLLNAPATGIRLEPTREVQSELERKLWSNIVNKK